MAFFKINIFMFKIIKKITRPNEGIPFNSSHTSSLEEYNNYFRNTFVVPGKFISSYSELSQNKLTLTTISIWRSHSDFLEFMADEYCYNTVIKPNKEHKEINNLEIEFSIEED